RGMSPVHPGIIDDGIGAQPIRKRVPRLVSSTRPKKRHHRSPPGRMTLRAAGTPEGALGLVCPTRKHKRDRAVGVHGFTRDQKLLSERLRGYVGDAVARRHGL